MAPGCFALPAWPQTARTWSVPPGSCLPPAASTSNPPACGLRRGARHASGPGCVITAGFTAARYQALDRVRPRRSGVLRPAAARLITAAGSRGRSGSARQRAGSRQAGSVWVGTRAAGAAGPSGCLLLADQAEPPPLRPGGGPQRALSTELERWRLQPGRPQAPAVDQ